MQPDVLDLLAQVRPADVHLVRVLREQRLRQRLARDDPVLAGVRLERPHRGDDDGRVRREARGPALDVEEPLGAHVGAEPGLGDQVVAGVDADQVGHHRRVAVRDVAERPGVHEDRRVLQRLQQVRRHRVAHDHGHRAGTADVLGGHRLAVARVADDDPAEPLAHLLHRAGQREDRHHLRRRGDVEPGLAGDTVHPGAEPDDHVAQHPVVDVEHAPPGDVVLVDLAVVALEQVVVQHRREHVVRGGDGVEVAGEVQVERLHRHHLRVAAARRAALDAEGRAHRRLPDGHRGALADVAHGLAEADRGGGLALTERGRGDGRDHHVLGLRPVGQLVDRVELDLGDVAAVRGDQVRRDAHLGGDVDQRPQRRRLGDLEVGRKPGHQAEPRCRAQLLGLVGAFPREVGVVAAEVAVGRGLAEDRPVAAAGAGGTPQGAGRSARRPACG